MTSIAESLISQPYDALILVHPQTQILDRISSELLSRSSALLNISKDLSSALMTISANERSRFAQEWLKDVISRFQNEPIICVCPDLLFHPSLNIDPYSLIRQTARIKQIIVLWPGEYSSNILTYAVPEHRHYRTWRISDSFLAQPRILIHQIPAAQGA